MQLRIGMSQNLTARTTVKVLKVAFTGMALVCAMPRLGCDTGYFDLCNRTPGCKAVQIYLRTDPELEI